ncbi:PTS fructose transporter subunit IIB [Halomicrococcus sp. NG-SE-24]|uniref:PTS fructose transporter subunit IIB n=1 Tax=Halomicrococcus sp. NG-SE-24 TaxID=3436928 RepID=UPI003D981076
MKIVAVTACPTGIAHSQMAAENLENAAEDAGHDIEVEVQGSMGTENELGSDDVAAAEAAIVAADTAVDESRFADLPLVKVPVAEAVNGAPDLVERAVEAAETGQDVDDPIRASGDGAEGSSDAGGGSDDGRERRGGDREKSILVRLKKFLSG